MAAKKKGSRRRPRTTNTAKVTAQPAEVKKKPKRRPRTSSTPKPIEEAKRELLEAAANPADAKHYGKDWDALTREGRLMRRSSMLQAIQLGAPMSTIRAVMEATYGCTKLQCDLIWRSVVKELRDDFTENIPYVKSQTVIRIRRDLSEMRGVPKGVTKQWSRILAHERFLARIEGTEAPIKVAMLDVNEAMRDNLASSLANSSDDRLRMLMEKGRQANLLIETTGETA